MGYKKTDNNYRVTIYLGKELHNKCKKISEQIELPFATLIKELVERGLIEYDKEGLYND